MKVNLARQLPHAGLKTGCWLVLRFKWQSWWRKDSFTESTTVTRSTVGILPGWRWRRKLSTPLSKRQLQANHLYQGSEDGYWIWFSNNKNHVHGASSEQMKQIRQALADYEYRNSRTSICWLQRKCCNRGISHRWTKLVATIKRLTRTGSRSSHHRWTWSSWSDRQTSCKWKMASQANQNRVRCLNVRIANFRVDSADEAYSNMTNKIDDKTIPTAWNCTSAQSASAMGTIWTDGLHGGLRIRWTSSSSDGEGAVHGQPDFLWLMSTTIHRIEDGPTHELVEYLAGLRAMPNLVMLSRCAWNAGQLGIFATSENTNRFVLTCQNWLMKRKWFAKGAYVVYEMQWFWYNLWLR